MTHFLLPHSMFVRLVSLAGAVMLATPAIHAETAAQLMVTGDGFDRKFRAKEALESYLPAEKLDPENVELLLRIARQYRHLMTDTANTKEKVRLGYVALTYGQKAASLGPKDSEAQLSPAITYGKMLPFQGSREQVAASPRIKAAVDKALKLDPNNDTAWHVLGRWHETLANVGGVKRSVGGMLYGDLPVGSNAEALKCFGKAIAINPERLRNYIEMGRTYAQADQPVPARKYLEKGLAMANKEKDDPEIKARGREALAKL